MADLAANGIQDYTYFAKKAGKVTSIFNIGNPTGEGNVLVCEWGKGYCCYATYDPTTKKLLHLNYYNLTNDVEQNIQSILDEIIKLEVSQVWVGVAFPYFTLLPSGYARNGKSVFQSVSTLPGKNLILEDNIPEWQINNVYAIPANIMEGVKNVFPEVHFIHYFTSTLKVYNGFVAEQQIAINFVPGQFQLVVKKGGLLVLAQMYEYQTTLDVVYYLLKIVDELALPKEELNLILSGLIEEESDLFREMHQYFENIHFTKAPANAIPNTEYPGHFFTSISNLAACVL